MLCCGAVDIALVPVLVLVSVSTKCLYWCCTVTGTGEISPKNIKEINDTEMGIDSTTPEPRKSELIQQSKDEMGLLAQDVQLVFPKIGDYDVPKNSAVLLNIAYLMHSEKYWENPQIFDPARFLSDDGKKVEIPEAFLPFGVGRRICPGEALAKNSLQIFVARLIQKMQFLPPKDKFHPHFPDSEKVDRAFTWIPYDYCLEINPI